MNTRLTHSTRPSPSRPRRHPLPLLPLAPAANDDNVTGQEITNGGAFDVAVAAFVLGLIQAIVILCLFRRAGDGPAVGCCCAAPNGLPVRAPREQQPTKQQFTSGV